jgi:hypothetical protein
MFQKKTRMKKKCLFTAAAAEMRWTLKVIVIFDEKKKLKKL